MALLIVVILLMVVIFFIQAPALFVNQLWRELAVFILFWALASVYAVTALDDVLFPPPSQVITAAMQFIYQFLGI